ncbi:MAG TPA: hypothetical protein VH370_21725 [Humisphaera sp.]|jgi:hypothetical protein|nr:hypothetical protein [Humisphaera sp.]
MALTSSHVKIAMITSIIIATLGAAAYILHRISAMITDTSSH